MMKLLGENGVAAITIMIYTQFLLTALYIGFAMGVAPVISCHYGMRDKGRLKRIFRICMIFIAAVSAVVFLVSMILGEPLVRIFSARGTAVYNIARKGFLIFPAAFLFCGTNIFASAFFTALSNGWVSAVISSLRTFVLLTMCLLILPSFLGVAGVWLAVPLSESATMAVSLGFIVKNRKKYGY